MVCACVPAWLLCKDCNCGIITVARWVAKRTNPARFLGEV
jgi:hypothetical protein